MLLKNSSAISVSKKYQDFSNDPMKNSSETDRDLEEYIVKMKLRWKHKFCFFFMKNLKIKIIIILQ